MEGCVGDECLKWKRWAVMKRRDGSRDIVASRADEGRTGPAEASGVPKRAEMPGRSDRVRKLTSWSVLE